MQRTCRFVVFRKPVPTSNSPCQSARTADFERVCLAWHRACEVQVLTPGVCGAEGKEKCKGVMARWGLEEAQSESAAQACPGPQSGEEGADMRCGRLGASGRVTAKPSIRSWGVCCESGVHAWKILCLTQGSLQGVIGKDTACGYLVQVWGNPLVPRIRSGRLRVEPLVEALSR